MLGLGIGGAILAGAGLVYLRSTGLSARAEAGATEEWRLEASGAVLGSARLGLAGALLGLPMPPMFGQDAE